MATQRTKRMGRRAFIAMAAAFAGVAGGHSALAQEGSSAGIAAVRNISAFRPLRWRTYFSDLQKGAILVDIENRALHYWSEDASIYRVFPSSVPMSEDLTRRGRSEVVRKVIGPSWSPTPGMKERNPEWPDYIAPGPDNPLGTHALYLSWTYYRIHGTHDTRKIGRRSSNGCVGLYNEHIAELFDMAIVGTQVLLV